MCSATVHVRFGSKADICIAKSYVRFARAKRTFTELSSQAPSVARLLKELAVIGHGVEELGDLLVHELDVGSLRRGCRKVTLQ